MITRGIRFIHRVNEAKTVSLEGIMADAAMIQTAMNGRSAAPAVAVARQARDLGGTLALNVLIIEQEAYTRTLCREIARTLNAEQIHAVSDAKSALTTLDTVSGINLIVCDERLPDMTGLEFLARLRRRNPGISFVLLSDHAEPAHIQMAIESGVSALVVKPFSRAQLEAKLRYLAHRMDVPKGAAAPTPHA
jgi:two-component system, chemotaxis family, chemotaxis protein CheY